MMRYFIHARYIMSATNEQYYGDINRAQKAIKSVFQSFFGTVATASIVLVGSSAMFNVVGRKYVSMNKKRNGQKCELCVGMRYVECGTCKGYGACEWQPINGALMERVCLCPTCSGTKMQKCIRCIGVGFL